MCLQRLSSDLQISRGLSRYDMLDLMNQDIEVPPAGWTQIVGRTARGWLKLNAHSPQYVQLRHCPRLDGTTVGPALRKES